MRFHLTPAQFFETLAGLAPHFQEKMFRGIALSKSDLLEIVTYGMKSTSVGSIMGNTIYTSNDLSEAMLYSIGNARNYNKEYAAVFVIDPAKANLKNKWPNGRSREYVTTSDISREAITTVLIFNKNLNDSVFRFSEFQLVR